MSNKNASFFSKVVKQVTALPTANKTALPKSFFSNVIDKLKTTTTKRSEINPQAVAEYMSHASPGATIKSIKKTVKQLNPTTNYNTLSRQLGDIEKLNGISNERIHVVQTLEYLPIFKDALGTHLTNEGEFFNIQANSYNLDELTIQNMLTYLIENDDEVKQLYEKRTNEFISQFRSMQGDMSLLRDVVQSVDKASSQLSPRSKTNTASLKSTVDEYLGKYQYSNNKVKNALKTQVGPTTLSYDYLLQILGYKPENYKTFSNTKIALQLLSEYKKIVLNHHQDLVDNSDNGRSNDKETFSIKQYSDKYHVVKLLNNESTQLSQLLVLNPENLNSKLVEIQRDFSRLFTNSGADTAERYAADIISVCKEFNYSLGLKTSSKFLADTVGYVVSDAKTNTTVFDHIIGEFPSNISEFPSQPKPLALTSLAHILAGDIGVLPYETSATTYGDSSIMSGAEYLFGDVFNVTTSKDDVKFNIANIEARIKKLSQVKETFGTVVQKFNLGLYDVADEFSNDSKDATVKNLTALKVISDKIIKLTTDNLNTSQTQTTSTNRILTAIFQRAQTNPKIKAALFVYFAYYATAMLPPAVSNKLGITSSTSNNRDQSLNSYNTTLLDAVIAYIIKHSFDGLGTSSTTSTGYSTTTITVGMLRSAFKNRAGLVKDVIYNMSSVVQSFYENDLFSKNTGRTLYTGMLDSTLLMTYFDALVQYIGTVPSTSFISKDATSSDSANITVSYQSNIKNFGSRSDSLTSKLSTEEMQLRYFTWYQYSQLNTQISNLNNIANLFRHNTDKNKPINKTIKKVITLTNLDTTKQLLSTQRLSYIITKLEEYKIKMGYQTNSGNKVLFFESNVIGDKLRDAMTAFLTEPKNIGKFANNKKIMTIGIPAGFSKKLNQQFNAESNIEDTSPKQTDVIKVRVFKTDLRYPELLFNPTTFLFDMTRFELDDENSILNSTLKTNIKDVIPTLLFTTNADGTGYNTTLSYKGSSILTTDTYNTSEYDFLAASQKDEIARNHSVSYVLNKYIKLMTGLSVNEQSFDRFVNNIIIKNMNDEDISLLFNKYYQLAFGNVEEKANSTTQAATGKLFRTTTQKVSALSAQMTEVNKKKGIVTTQSPVVNTDTYHKQLFVSVLLTQLSKFTNKLTNMSSSLHKHVLSTSYFDRTFNILIDSDDFSIDVQGTTGSEEGKKILSRLVEVGEVVVDNSGTYVLRTKDVNEGDIVFEKYILDVETVGYNK